MGSGFVLQRNWPLFDPRRYLTRKPFGLAAWNSREEKFRGTMSTGQVVIESGKDGVILPERFQ